MSLNNRFVRIEDGHLHVYEGSKHIAHFTYEGGYLTADMIEEIRTQQYNEPSKDS